MDSTLLNTLIRHEHMLIWKEVSETAMKDGVEEAAIKKLSPYVYVALEKLRKKLSRPHPGAAAAKRKPEASKLEPKPKKPSPPAKASKEVKEKEKLKEVERKEEKNEKVDQEKKKMPTLAKEFNNLKDYNLIIIGIPTIDVEESPKLKVIKLPYMAPEKLTAALKDTKGWDKTNHAVIVIPRAWSGIDGAEDKIYELMDALERLSETLELSFLAPPVDDKTPEGVHQFINRVKTKMIIHDLPPATFQSRGRICQKWYADAIKSFLKMVMDKEDINLKSISDISLAA
uniref:Uncharacterized protein n=1 Tax=Panagrolaimus sp. ES5 TaxID=591445 RepID=A0AC34G1B7_9BILA